MTLQSAVILLGLAALVIVFAVSFWKDRFGGLLSWRRRGVPSVGGLISPDEFVLRRGRLRGNREPTLDRLDEGAHEPPGFAERGSIRLDDSLFEDLDAQDLDAPHQVTIEEAQARREAWEEARREVQHEEQQRAHAAHPEPETREDVPQDDAGDSPGEDPEEDHDSVRQLDYWVRIIGEDPVYRDHVLSIYRQHEYRLEHAHGIHGRLVPSGEWRDLEREPESSMFRNLVLTLQLADRDGAVTESEMTRFNNMVLELAEGLNRQFKFHGSVEEALAQARRVERFCLEYDVLAIINICGDGGRQFSGSEVLRAVEGSGMRYGKMKVFHGPDDSSGEPLYSVANMVKPGVFELDKMGDFSTPGLSMFMSVPRCPNPGDVFSRMAYVAGKITTHLGGVMLDQENNPLNERAIQRIRRQVQEIDRQMTEKGIRPGSEEALRLF